MGALRYLPAQQPPVVHGDLKGSNIRVEQSGLMTMLRAKLLDFGLSRLATVNAVRLGGTVRWMAPELFRGRHCPPDSSADVFSFGRVIYFVLTGRTPLCTLTNADIVKRAKKRASVPALVWPEQCAFHDKARVLCDEMLLFESVLRPSIIKVHMRLAAWTPGGSAAEAVLITARESFAEAVRQARAEVAQQRQSLPTTRVQPQAIGYIAAARPGELACIDEASGEAETEGDQRCSPMLVLPNFLETPDETKEILVLDAISKWNWVVPPCGAACCSFHYIMRQELLRVQTRLALSMCDADFKPHAGWQCPECKAVEVLDPEESALVCMVCGYSNSILEHKRLYATPALAARREQDGRDDAESADAEVPSACL
eukprot:NODE_10897_length_1322_cov_3.416736.p1 GENE.NODE_10897_length_1322_cov_3.416736~~NODE_10897_length_1322_cov_3.416736.p1  ORF type:complete len:371 (-),score=77.09 NODE_10897_length_1322_cov_3.416736:209-1321(-)